jgi:hypothetical protein
MKMQAPQNASYDVAIIGGAIMGASAAWFLSDDKGWAYTQPGAILKKKGKHALLLET